ncbi:MAG: PHP domain-containing protein, partial [Sphingomicrobium sp.]
MLEGAMEPKTIAERTALLGFPAAAITDRNGLYGVMPFSDACFAKGVQPIIGTTLGVARPPAMGCEGGIDSLVLLAQDEAGYANLCKLVSAAHLDRPLELAPHVPFALLQAYGAGLIALTAGAEGALARLIADGQLSKANAYLEALEVFAGRLYIEFARRNDPIETAAEAALIDLAYARDLPMVATNPAAYPDPAFHAAHDALLCIANSAYIESADRPTSSPDAWLKDGAAMA